MVIRGEFGMNLPNLPGLRQKSSFGMRGYRIDRKIIL